MGTELECGKCGYEWEYSGEMQKATCPRCSDKVPTGIQIDETGDKTGASPTSTPEERMADAQERIADALERIADELEGG